MACVRGLPLSIKLPVVYNSLASVTKTSDFVEIYPAECTRRLTQRYPFELISDDCCFLGAGTTKFLVVIFLGRVNVFFSGVPKDVCPRFSASNGTT